MMPDREAIDLFCHWLPPRFAAAALKAATRRLHMLERAAAMPVMVDLEARFRVMDGFPGYRQVPSLASPPIELIAGPEATPDLARRANDEQAELAAEHPDRFQGFVAALPMNHPEAALVEAERAIRDLGAVGIQVFSHVGGRPLDAPEFLPLFALSAEMDRPVWLHPARGMTTPDYPSESVSRYECWWALGWPYETSVAMYRLVFASVFDRWPKLAIITHHAGGMIPLMEGRLGWGLDLLGTRTPSEHANAVQTPLNERPLDAFRHFYADTATFGSAAALRCAREFFGTERLLFASDMPFDPEGGPLYIRETLRAIDELELPDTERQAILSGNARALLMTTLRAVPDC